MEITCTLLDILSLIGCSCWWYLHQAIIRDHNYYVLYCMSWKRLVVKYGLRAHPHPFALPDKDNLYKELAATENRSVWNLESLVIIRRVYVCCWWLSLQPVFPATSETSLFGRGVSLDFGGFMGAVSETLAWLLDACNALSSQPPVAQDTDELKEQFQHHEVLRLVIYQQRTGCSPLSISLCLDILSGVW